ncbi:hypothetical protein P7K49_019011, partial [Saguinus oedipus]
SRDRLHSRTQASYELLESPADHQWDSEVLPDSCGSVDIHPSRPREKGLMEKPNHETKAESIRKPQLEPYWQRCNAPNIPLAKFIRWLSHCFLDQVHVPLAGTKGPLIMPQNCTFHSFPVYTRLFHEVVGFLCLL